MALELETSPPSAWLFERTFAATAARRRKNRRGYGLAPGGHAHLQGWLGQDRWSNASQEARFRPGGDLNAGGHARTQTQHPEMSLAVTRRSIKVALERVSSPSVRGIRSMGTAESQLRSGLPARNPALRSCPGHVGVHSTGRTQAGPIRSR